MVMVVAIVGSMMFLMVAILYILLAIGLPFGELAMGGKFKIMPKNMRIVCAFSVVIQLFAVIIILQTAEILPLMFSMKVTRGVCYFFAAYLTLNVIMNLASKSKKERLIMYPISSIAAICFWIIAITAIV